MAHFTIRDLPPRKPGEGIEMRLIHGERMTFAYFTFAPGTPLPEHRHPHEQIGTVVKGEMELTIAGETHLVEVRVNNGGSGPADDQEELLGRLARAINGVDSRVLATVEEVGRDYGGISTVNLSPGGQSISIQMGDLPFPPTGISPSRTSNQQAVPFNYVSWDGADPGEVIGYHVYRSSSETGTFVRIATVPNPGLASAPFVEDYAIDEQIIYWYKVSGYNSFGEGDASTPLPDNW